MTEHHILSLGAGVQSTTVYLLALDGAFHLDAAIFADTGDEPKAVYSHLGWLLSLDGPPIYIRSRGRLSDSLLTNTKVFSKEFGSRQRFAAVPFFTRKPDGDIGMTRRQCSKEYKVEVVERCIRRDIVGLKPRQRIPKTTIIHQYFGISLDEARRTIGIKKRVANPHFPLIERGWTRADCARYLAARVPHEVPRSACVYCPFHSNAEWAAIQSSPEDWPEALRVDDGLRVDGNIVNRNMDAQMFAHRSCVPLRDIDFQALLADAQAKQAEASRIKSLQGVMEFNRFTEECEGMCGV